MVLSIFSYSVLLTWIYVGTGGSLLMTALVHGLLNGVAPIMGGVDNEASWAIRNILAAAIAVAIVVLGGFRRTEATQAIAPTRS
jgi:membrane protease YdiL (CAAX protease family)